MIEWLAYMMLFWGLLITVIQGIVLLIEDGFHQDWSFAVKFTLPVTLAFLASFFITSGVLGYPSF